MIKKLRLFVGIMMLSFLFIACGSETENDSKVESVDQSSGESCLYSYDKEGSSVNWTAFKTTQRVAVGGSFDSVLVSLPDTIRSPKEALKNASFSIISSSVFTNNTIRDGTIRKYFFSKLKNDGNIEGNIRIVEGTDKFGSGTIVLNINDVKRDIGFKYTIEGDVIIIKTKITLVSFEGEEAVQSLNTECKDVHAGADGVSKLWPDLEIEVKAALKKKC
jgi:hypothetical protein